MRTTRRMLCQAALASLPLLLVPARRATADITSNLVVHYLLNETSGGTAADASGTGNTATVEGTPTWIASPRGGALQLNTATDWVQRVSGVGLPTGATAAFTLAGWIKAAAYINLSHLFGFGQDPLDAAGPGDQRGILAFNNHYYFWGAGADWDPGIVFDADNAWHHIAFTASSSTLIFYRDGTERATSARPGSLVTAATKIVLGRNNPSGTAFLGAVDDVRIYARALVQADITELVGTSTVAKRRALLFD